MRCYITNYLAILLKILFLGSITLCIQYIDEIMLSKFVSSKIGKVLNISNSWRNLIPRWFRCLTRGGPLGAQFNVRHCAPKSVPVRIRLNNPHSKCKSVCSVISLKVYNQSSLYYTFNVDCLMEFSLTHFSAHNDAHWTVRQEERSLMPKAWFYWMSVCGYVCLRNCTLLFSETTRWVSKFFGSSFLLLDLVVKSPKWTNLEEPFQNNNGKPNLTL